MSIHSLRPGNNALPPLSPVQPTSSSVPAASNSWIRSAMPGDQFQIQTRSAPMPSVSFLLSLQDLRENQGYLKLGDSGDAVRYVQQRLQHWGHELEADGVYGQQTVQAVESFQRLNGFPVSAMVGEMELRLLDQARLSTPPASGSADSLDDIRQNRAYLQPGSTGEAVSRIQELLKGRGYALTIDGDYGSQTTQAVRNFQQDYGIQVNGRVGQMTLAALETPTQRRPELQTVRSGQQMLQAGDSGPAVRAIQERLSAWGYGVGIDGDYGPKTAEAVRSFQRDNHIQSNGRVGSTTLAALEQTPRPTATGIRPTAKGTRLAQVAEQVARRRNTTGWCYAGVADSVSRALGTALWGKSAYMAADILARTPGFREHKNVRPADLTKLPAGAIVVWGKTGASPHGHISVALGNGKEASDHVARQMTSLRGHTNFRVFMPN